MKQAPAPMHKKKGKKIAGAASFKKAAQMAALQKMMAAKQGAPQGQPMQQQMPQQGMRPTM